MKVDSKEKLPHERRKNKQVGPGNFNCIISTSGYKKGAHCEYLAIGQSLTGQLYLTVYHVFVFGPSVTVQLNLTMNSVSQFGRWRRPN
jgi:hypothetical protein